MKIQILELVDYMSMTMDHKISLCGISRHLAFPSLPQRYRAGCIVVELLTNSVERNRPIDLAIVLIDPDGKELFRLTNPPIEVPAEAQGDISLCAHLPCPEMEFTVPGAHRLLVMDADRILEERTIQVIKPKQAHLAA